MEVEHDCHKRCGEHQAHGDAPAQLIPDREKVYVTAEAFSLHKVTDEVIR